MLLISATQKMVLWFKRLATKAAIFTICRHNMYVYMRGSKIRNHLLKHCAFIFYMFKFQSPSKDPPFDAMHLLRLFFHCLKQFLNLSILMPFSASASFCFTSSTPAKCFPLRIFFIESKKKKVAWGKIG